MSHKGNNKKLFENKILLLTNFGRHLIDDKSQVIFLNQRCLSCTEIVEKHAKFISYPHMGDDLGNLEGYEEKVFDDMMQYIAPILSELNNVNYSKEYWKYYISFEFEMIFWSFYSMYWQIKNAIEKYPGIKIVCFEDDEYDIAQLNIRSMQYQAYIHQLIGKQIVVALNYPNLKVKKVRLEDFYKENRNYQTVKRKCLGVRDIIRKGYDWVYKILSIRTNSIITYSFSNNIRNLQKEMLGKAFFCGGIRKAKHLNIFCDIQKRENFIEKLSGNIFEDQFENILIHNIGYDLSLDFLENYEHISQATKYLKKMKFDTYVKFLYDPESLEYAAYIKEGGGKIVECSHSVEEGWRLWKTLCVKEADYYFSWSEKKYLSYDNYLECISYMLHTIKSVNYMENRYILYARGSETSPYATLSVYFIIAERISMYETVLRPVKFYNELGSTIQKCMLYRNRDDWGEGSRKLIETYCPNTQFDDSFENGRYQSFSEQLQKSRIVVVESIHSTSFFQAIMYGMPTIIIENLDYRGLLNDEVLNLLEELKKVDVWFEDASKAGKVISENYEKIDEWWNMPERKNVIKKIQSQLWVKLDDKSESEWWQETLAELK